MKKLSRPLQFILCLILTMAYTQIADAQILKKLGKRAEKAAERALERRVEKETNEKTEMVLDSIFEPGSNNEGKENSPVPQTQPDDAGLQGKPMTTTGSGVAEGSNPSSTKGSPALNVYSKFDFVPGDKVLFFDDFSNDFIGDFPAKWNTNSSGDLVQINGEPGKWLKLLPGFTSQYIPDVTNLPKEFTVEFDLVTTGLNKKTSSQSYLSIVVSDNNSFDKPKNFGMVEYPFCQFIDAGVIVENNVNGKREIRNTIATDLRQIVLGEHHIAIAVNEQRFRMWSNEKKIVDVPRLLPFNVQMNAIKIGLRGIDTTTEGVYVSNMKIAEGGVDLRRKLLSEGKISTNGILFDSGSANILPQSMGIIRQIYQVLQQDDDLKLKIVGHTDADGDDEINIELSKKRAEAVKTVLTVVYNVSSKRLQTEGKGASEPMGDNNSVEGKSQNRRVEFIQLAKTSQ